MQAMTERPALIAALVCKRVKVLAQGGGRA